MTHAIESPLLEIDHVTKAYNTTPALRGVNLQVVAGDVVCLLGPSGCGKTTLLRIIAGLEQADSGAVRFGGQPIDAVPIHQRGFGLMFQDYALFPHRNVADNIAFGLRMQHKTPAQIASRVADMLELVGLAGYDRRRVYELSGGERQRVALARSLAPAPRLLMLDEPLGALDRALRERLLDELRTILKRVGVTSIYVTHDQAEAFAIADQLVLMRSGAIEQQGAPEALYRHPATVFAARFMGLSNLVEARVTSQPDGSTTLATALGSLQVPGAYPVGTHVTAVIRPEAAHMVAKDLFGTNAICGTVVERTFQGNYTRLTLRHESGQELVFQLDATNLPEVGEETCAALRSSGISVIAHSDQGSEA